MILLGTLSMRHRSVRSSSTGLVCHSPEINWERPGVGRITENNEWRRRLRSDLRFGSSGQRRTNILVARTYARWPLRASGLLDPLARTGPPSEKSRRASGQCRGLPSSHFACLSQVTSFQKLLHTHVCMTV